MAHDRNAALVEESDGFGHLLAAFQLHRGGARLLEQIGSIFERLFLRRLVGTERHVDDHDRVIAAPDDGGRMVRHHLQRDGNGRWQSVDHLAERIPDQQDVAMRIEDLRLTRRIGGQHDQRFLRFAVCLVGANLRHRQPFHWLGRGVGAAGARIELECGRHWRALASAGEKAKQRLDTAGYPCLKPAPRSGDRERCGKQGIRTTNGRDFSNHGRGLVLA